MGKVKDEKTLLCLIFKVQMKPRNKLKEVFPHVLLKSVANKLFNILT